MRVAVTSAGGAVVRADGEVDNVRPLLLLRMARAVGFELGTGSVDEESVDLDTTDTGPLGTLRYLGTGSDESIIDVVTPFDSKSGESKVR